MANKKTKNEPEKERPSKTELPLERCPLGPTSLAQSEAPPRGALMNVKVVTIKGGDIRCTLECGFDSEVAALLAECESGLIPVEITAARDRTLPDIAEQTTIDAAAAGADEIVEHKVLREKEHARREKDAPLPEGVSAAPSAQQEEPEAADPAPPVNEQPDAEAPEPERLEPAAAALATEAEELRRHMEGT